MPKILFHEVSELICLKCWGLQIRRPRDLFFFLIKKEAMIELLSALLGVVFICCFHFLVISLVSQYL